ncbi:hypothetical protein AVEN_205307-1 [Araneus ventricosus]|uniref:Uncharacterized protein n=1 Tax=Araneus ventricosus TaxID=182803 RepID=A0A4Y2K9A0_ARAVE|nr:hypothetical protein AVEN_205307-1 [Araneus ventricosus]
MDPKVQSSVTSFQRHRDGFQGTIKDYIVPKTQKWILRYNQGLHRSKDAEVDVQSRAHAFPDRVWTYFCVSYLPDELEAEEVGEDLRDVVDDGGDAEECGGAPQVLQVPEEEGEDEADAEAHEPGDVEEGSVAQVGEGTHHGEPLGQLTSGLREHGALDGDKRNITLQETGSLQFLSLPTPFQRSSSSPFSFK